MSDGTNPQDPTTDAVVPPAPPETPIPDGLIPPEPSIPDAPDAETPPPPHIPPADVVIPPAPDIPPADAVIPPPPPEAPLRSTRRPAPGAFADSSDRPTAAADDWAQPSVAPDVPTSGGYRVLTGVIFTLLVLLLIGAIALGAVLAATTSFPWSSGDAAQILAAVGISPS